MHQKLISFSFSVILCRRCSLFVSPNDKDALYLFVEIVFWLQYERFGHHVNILRLSFVCSFSCRAIFYRTSHKCPFYTHTIDNNAIPPDAPSFGKFCFRMEKANYLYFYPMITIFDEHKTKSRIFATFKRLVFIKQNLSFVNEKLSFKKEKLSLFVKEG